MICEEEEVLLEVDPRMTIIELKNEIYEETGQEPQEQTLSFATITLPDDLLLGDIPDTVQVSIRKLKIGRIKGIRHMSNCILYLFCFKGQ